MNDCQDEHVAEVINFPVVPRPVPPVTSERPEEAALRYCENISYEEMAALERFTRWMAGEGFCFVRKRVR